MVSVVSLFSGCGGLDLGFHDDFFDLVTAYDNDPAAIKCLRHNLKIPAKVIDVTSKEFESELDSLDSADIVLGGFPCQGFSKAGPKNTNDPRNQLYLAMLKAVNRLKPSIFIGENVDGIAQNFKGTFVENIKRDFKEIGYNVEYRILNAVNYGVPQYRRRVIFVGTKNTSNVEFLWPVPTHLGGSRNGEFKTKWDVVNQSDIFSPENLRPAVTLKDALGDLLKEDPTNLDHSISSKIREKDLRIIAAIGEGQKLCNVRFSDTSVYTWDIPTVFGKTTKKERQILESIGKNRRKKLYGDIPNGNPLSIDVISSLTGLDINESELLSLVERKYLRIISGKFDLTGAMFCSGLYKRPLWNEPSPTVLTVFNSPRFLTHPLKDRPFTVRECARLQSFPDSFEFLSSGVTVEDAYRLIGNAVPPLLASNIAKSVKEYMLNSKLKYEINATSTFIQ
jgi:DNA (cytosine-5)-methyltransferase 1